MAYTIISQNNTTTTLSDENGNVITVPSRSILDAGTTFTLVKINNSTATLEDSNGKIYRDIPCCVDLTQVTGFTVTKVNNNKATLEDADGITYAGVPCIVNLTESGGGSSAVIDPLNVTPSTSAQTITASGGVDGYSPVNVSAVDASIDANITAGNIKKDVSILGVTGTYEGQTPTGSISITSNGTYDVTDKAEAVVNVPTTAPAYYVERIVDANGTLKLSSYLMNLSGFTDVGDRAMSHLYYWSSNSIGGINNVDVDLSGLTTISGNYACEYAFEAAGVKTVDLSSLTSITGMYACQNMFSTCGSLISVDVSSLTTISGQGACMNMFSNTNNLPTINFNSLVSINASNNQTFNSAFSRSGIQSAYFNKLNVIKSRLSGSFQEMFAYCYSLGDVYFGGLTASTFADASYQLSNIFNASTGQNATNGCTVHFPSNFDPADPNHTFDASTLAGYPTFGGSASYIHVAFDLPATE